MSKEKLSISKKTVLIASALVIAIGIPIAYFLATNNSEDSRAWYSSSWLYRKSISVANPNSTLTNEDVLIEYDTASLISAGKLQPDCDDLRFVDSDDSTTLAYWIEGGCNTPTTHIWVRIPSLPSGGKTIYMYYGNSSATSAEDTWNGKFYLMKDTECDTDWTTESNPDGSFFQRFPYPAATFGETGGSNSHNHGSYDMQTSTVSTSINVNSSGTNSISNNHYHNVTLYTEDNTSVLPPYLDMIFCSNSDLIIKQNSVAEFTSTVPIGFTRFSALDNKFPRGNSSYGESRTSTTHTHTISAVSTKVTNSTGTAKTGTVTIPSGTHIHTAPETTTGIGTHIPPYITIIYGKATASDIMAPSGMITMSNAVPPLGWTRYSELDGYFTFGNSSYGSTGGASTHTHSIPSLTLLETSNTVSASTSPPASSQAILNHTHTTPSITSTEYSNTPPYISSLFIQKKKSQSVTINNETRSNQPPNPPTSLLTEEITNPTNITDTTPEFSAIFTDDDNEDTGTHYQIQVNTQNDFNGTVMWDSTKVKITPITNKNRSPNISYNGLPLSLNGAKYYWRIKFWDSNDNSSDWSQVASFEMNSLLRVKESSSSSMTPSSVGSENLYTESVGQSTWNTNTTYQEKSSLTFTPQANSTYLIIASWLMQNSSASYQAKGKLTRITGSAKNFNELIYRPKDATDYISGGAIGIDSFGSSPTSQTYQIQYATNNSSGTVRIKEAKMIALKLDENLDKYAESEARTTTTSTTYQDKTTLTFTPSSAGDYILIATATFDGSSTSYDSRIQMTIDGSAYSTSNIETVNASNRYPWVVVKKIHLTAAPHTIKIQYGSEGSSNTAGIADARIVAIRADRFLNNYYAENETRATTTSTSYQTRVTLTETPQAANHLVLAVEDLDGSSTSYSTYGEALMGSTTYGEMLIETKDGANRGSQYFTLKKETLTNSPTSWYLRYRAESSSRTAGINNARILVLELTEPSINVGTTGSQIGTVNPSTSDVHIGGAFTFVRDKSSDTVTAITVSKAGTISDTNLSGLILYYKQEDTCSSTIPQDAIQFNSTPGTFSLGTSTVTGSMSVGTSQICVYPKFDIGNANAGDTIEIQITNPSTQVSSTGHVTPESVVAINGTTTVASSNNDPDIPSSLQTESSIDPTEVTDTTPEFSAIFTDTNSSDTGTYYRIEVNTNNTFTGTIMWDSGKTAISPITNGSRSTDISYSGTTLTLNGSTYYWRIKFWDNNGGESNWSATAQFTLIANINPNSPSSLYTEALSNPTEVTDTTPEFSAIFTDTNSSDTGIYYRIEVNTNNTFTGTIMWDSGKTAISPITNGSRSTDISYSGTALTLNGSTYYWRMKFWDNNGGESNWSATAQFTMSAPPTAPSNPQIDGMTNPTQIPSTLPKFSALHYDANGDSAIYFQIQVNSNSSFTGTTMWDTNKVSMSSTPSGQYIPEVTYAGTALTGESNITYYWRVRLWDTDDNVSNWSTTATFVDFVDEEQYLQMEGVKFEGVKINPT